jgi:hypothetical protein
MIEYEMVLLESRKETENKLRWDAQLTDAAFSLYIPKEQVPDPWPGRIRVRVEALEGRRPGLAPNRVPTRRSQSRRSWSGSNRRQRLFGTDRRVTRPIGRSGNPTCHSKFSRRSPRRSHPS